MAAEEEATTAALAALSLSSDAAKDGGAGSASKAPTPFSSTSGGGAALGLEDLAISPLEFFAEECGNEEDAFRRLEAYRRIRLIAAAIGPEETEAALLPFLQEKAASVRDDEALLIMAQELGDAAALVPTPTALLPCLAALAGTEETVVRDAAVAAVVKVLAALPPGRPVPEAVEALKALAQGEMFSHKLSAAALFPAVYARAESEEQREVLRALLETTLAADEAPMVRRGVALALPGIIKAMPLDLLTEFVVPVYKRLAGDDQDMVRIAATEATPAVAQGLQATGIDDQNLQHVVPVVRAAVEDRSWRVRQAIAKGYADVSVAVKGEGGQRALEALHHDLLPGLVALLQDNEAEVRTAACSKSFAAYCDVVGPQLFIQHLIPCAQALAPDTIPGVRLALAAACLDLAPKLGQETFMRYLMPLLERFLLPDPNQPDPVKVRLHILQRLAVIGAWLPSLQETFLPVLLQLREDDNWRVRKAAIEALPVLGEHMDLTLFDQRLLPHLLSAFQDRVCEVRTAATVALQHLARVTGPDFVESKLLPRVKGLYEEASFYLVRLAVLQALKSLTLEGASDSLLQSVSSLVLAATKDRIPNVRFTAAQVLARLSTLVDEATLQREIRPCLEELVASDPDGDVKYYAALALEGKEAPAPGPAPVDAAGVGSAVGAVAVSAQG